MRSGGSSAPPQGAKRRLAIYFEAFRASSQTAYRSCHPSPPPRGDHDCGRVESATPMRDVRACANTGDHREDNSNRLLGLWHRLARYGEESSTDRVRRCYPFVRTGLCQHHKFSQWQRSRRTSGRASWRCDKQPRHASHSDSSGRCNTASPEHGSDITPTICNR